MADYCNDVWENLYREFSTNCDNSDTERDEMEIQLYSKIHFIQQDTDYDPYDFNKQNIQIKPYVPVLDKSKLYELQVVNKLTNFSSTGNKCLNEKLHVVQVEPSCTFTEHNTNLLSKENTSNLFEKFTKNERLKIKKVKKKEKKRLLEEKKNEKTSSNKLMNGGPHADSSVIEISSESSTGSINEVTTYTKSGKKTSKTVKNKLACPDDLTAKGRKKEKKGKNSEPTTQINVKNKADKKVKKNKKKIKQETAPVNQDNEIEISSDFSPTIPAPKIKRRIKKIDYILKKELGGEEVIVLNSTSEEKDTPIKVKKKKQKLLDPIVISDSESSDEHEVTNASVSVVVDKDVKTKDSSSDSSDSDNECAGVLLEPDDAHTKSNVNLKMNVRASQESLLNECDSGKHWAIIEEDRCRVTNTLSRYFEPFSIQCTICKKMGHSFRYCPEAKPRVCYYCAMADHISSNCSESRCCLCQSRKHTSKYCSHAAYHLNLKCYRCFMYGHQQNHCPDLWRQYHMTTEGGNPVKVQERQNENRSCYNCGSRKHFGFECEKRRLNLNSVATYPYIAKYGPVQSVKGNKRKQVAGSQYNQPSKKMKKQNNSCPKKKKVPTATLR